MQIITKHIDIGTIPKSVYITFEDNLSVVRALASNKLDKQTKRVEILKSQCFGDKPFRPVNEPSDIIWENQHTGPCARISKCCLSYCCVVISLVIYAILVWAYGQLAIFDQNGNYSPVNCDQIYEEYNYNSNQTILQNAAYVDYLIGTNNTIEQSSNGCLGCFCDKQKSQLGKKKVSNTEYGGPFGFKPAPICGSYFATKAENDFNHQVFVFELVVINSLFASFAAKIVQYTGAKTKTSEIKQATLISFIA